MEIAIWIAVYFFCIISFAGFVLAIFFGHMVAKDEGIGPGVFAFFITFFIGVFFPGLIALGIHNNNFNEIPINQYKEINEYVSKDPNLTWMLEKSLEDGKISHFEYRDIEFEYKKRYRSSEKNKVKNILKDKTLDV
jgi:hypothetical protein